MCPFEITDEAFLVATEPVDVKLSAFKTCIIEYTDVKSIDVEEGATVESTAAGCDVVNGDIKYDSCKNILATRTLPSK